MDVSVHRPWTHSSSTCVTTYETSTNRHAARLQARLACSGRRFCGCAPTCGDWWRFRASAARLRRRATCRRPRRRGRTCGRRAAAPSSELGTRNGRNQLRHASAARWLSCVIGKPQVGGLSAKGALPPRPRDASQGGFRPRFSRNKAGSVHLGGRFRRYAFPRRATRGVPSMRSRDKAGLVRRAGRDRAAPPPSGALCAPRSCPRSCPRPPGFSLRRCAPDADAHFPASPRSSWSRRGARSRFPSDRGTKMQFSNVSASSRGRFRSSARPLLVAGEKFNGEAAGQGGASSRGVGAVPGGPCGELHFCAANREKMRSAAPAPRARAAGARAAGDVSPMRPFVVGIRDESRRKPLPPASMPTSPAWGGRRR